jgi:hypothetical protein
MPEISVALNLRPDEFLAYYRGTARHVVARAENGQTIQFPAAILQRFVTHDGIRGRFVIHVDAQNRFLRIERAGL